MSRIFVAGGTGVLGRRAVPALLAAGHEVSVNSRNDAARQRLLDVGAVPVVVDLFDRAAVEAAAGDHDVVVNLATSIPTGVRSVRPSAWSMNDRLRTDAAANLANAVRRAGGRYVGESITFPYVDSGAEWVDESTARTYFSGNSSVVDAEAAAAAVTDAGGVGVALRFAMFFADDSAHIATYRNIARGVFGLTGRPDSHISFVHVDDAAAAVVAALDAPPGVYNVAEPEPSRRVDHQRAVTRAVGRRRVLAVPASLSKFGGSALDSVSRSQRISSAKLTGATGWRPQHHVVDHWG